MTNRLKQIFDEDRRLVFLCILASDSDYASNHYVVKDALAQMGHSVPIDRVLNDAAWLAEQGLITITHPAAHLCVYKITARGKDVAEGRTTVPGVKRPEPGLDY